MSWSFARGIAVAFALAALLLCGRGQAEDYPTRPITIIVSLAAGTGMDTAVRLYGESGGAARLGRCGTLQSCSGSLASPCV